MKLAPIRNLRSYEDDEGVPTFYVERCDGTWTKRANEEFAKLGVVFHDGGTQCFG